MKRKHFLNPVILSLSFLFILFTWAQAQDNQYEKIKSIKIAYITEQLSLTPAEAEVFWPVYNDFENRRNLIRDERKKVIDNFKTNAETMSEKDVSKVLDEYIGFCTDENDLMILYNKKLKEILPPEKVMKLHLAEIQFRHHLIEQLREQRHNSGPKN
jgi:hypothetical protein